MSNFQPHSTGPLAERLLDVLPQTQCTKCGYAGCRPYAEAMARDEADHNRCPPGGAEGVARLAQILGRPVIALDPESGLELPRVTAVIDPQRCIGCTLCIQACPVDAIVGAPKQMHVVLADWCTGCDLCVPPCPVDCIDLPTISDERTGWNAWSENEAQLARERHDFRSFRLHREKSENDARLAAKASAKLAALEQEANASAEEQQALDRKKAIIAAALERARQQRATVESAGPAIPEATDPDLTR